MSTKPVVNNITDIETWFLQNSKYSFWTIRTGHGASKSCPIFQKNQDENDHEDSWQLLKQNITMLISSGGKISIALDDHPSVSNPKAVLYAHFVGSNSNVGISGANGAYGNDVSIAGGIAAYVQKELSIDRQNRKIEDLENHIAAIENNPVNKIDGFLKTIESACENPIIQGVIMKFMKSPVGQSPINGAEEPTQMTFDSEAEYKEYLIEQNRVQEEGIKAAQEQMENRNAEIEKLGDVDAKPDSAPMSQDDKLIEAALIRLRVHFPKLGFALTSVADKVDNNPEMFKTMINV